MPVVGKTPAEGQAGRWALNPLYWSLDMLVSKPHRQRRQIKKLRRRSFPGSVYNGEPPQVLEDLWEIDELYTWSDSRETENSPNWRSRIAQGLNATGSLFGVEETYDISDGYHYHRVDFFKNSAFWYYDETWRYGGLFPTPHPTGAYLSPVKADNRALQEFFSNARSAQTSLQGLVTAGEMGQTLRGINRGANAIYRGLWGYVDSLRKGTVLRNLRLLSKKGKTAFVRDRWLETQLFIMPLASEVKSLAEALARLGPYYYQQNDKFIAGFGVDHERKNNAISDGPGSSRARMMEDRYAEVRYYGKVSLSEAIPGVPDLTPFGFDSSNFLPALWNLIPYSFVFDYFGNIQHILSAFAFNKTLIKWSTRTVRLRNENSLGPAWLMHPNSEVEYERLAPGSILRTSKTVNRSAMNLPPSSPTLEFRIPGLTTQWMNVAALASASRATQSLIH